MKIIDNTFGKERVGGKEGMDRGGGGGRRRGGKMEAGWWEGEGREGEDGG